MDDRPPFRTRFPARARQSPSAGRTATLCAGLAAVLLASVGCGSSAEYRTALDEGLLLFRRGNYRAASSRLETAVDLEAGEAKPRLFLARSQILLNRLHDAQENLLYLEKKIGLDALASAGEVASVHVDLGALELRKALDEGETGSYFKAQGYFERALDLNPDYYLALLGKGFCLYGLEQYSVPGGGDSAVRFFTRCGSLQPNRPEPSFYLGACNEKDRLLSTLEALELYESVLALSGDPDSLKPGETRVTRIFSVHIRAVDRNYALLALERIVPLMARIPPGQLGLDGVKVREKARRRFELYTSLDGKQALPQAVVDWMQGAARSTGATETPHPGSPGNGSAGSPPRRAGLRPEIALLAPSSPDVRTGSESVAITVQSVDDAPGAALRVHVNGDLRGPEFRDVKIKPASIQGREGERRTMTFDAILQEGENEIVLQIVDREGLTSDKIVLKASRRIPALFAVVAGCDGPGNEGKPRLRFAESDARAFMDLLAKRFPLPPANRALLVGPEGSARAFRDAVRRAASAAWESDAVVVYFAGFGATLEGRSGTERYLVFPGFDSDRPGDEGVPLSGLGPLLDASRAGCTALVLDAGFGPGPAAGGRTLPGAAGAPDPWKEGLTNLFQIPEKLKVKLTLILGSDGSGTAQEIGPETPEWRKGGLLTTFLLEILGKTPEKEGAPISLPPETLMEYLHPRLSYFAAREGQVQSPVVFGPKGKPWLGR